MDPFNNNATVSNTETVAAGESLQASASSEYRPRQLQKKRSFTGGRADGAKARKGSIRSAVRRIFGRRSREGDSRPTPPLLYTPEQYVEGTAFGFAGADDNRENEPKIDEIVQRALSAPALAPSSLHRPASPYGFPHSARLKPLDLGNPFTAAKSQASRRKSMPSLLVNEADAAALSAEIEAANVVVAIDADTLHAVETSIGLRRHEKRRSRSANDLRRDQQDVQASPRRQKEDMRKWRESLGGGVLRTSGFTTRSPPRPPTVEREDSKTPLANETPFLDTTTPAITTPAFQRDQSEREIGSASAFGTEMSHDLEDRVSRLEAGLNSFRGQLAQLSADRNRRTILIGSTPGEPGTSVDYRSASMLATDLRDDLRPSDYEYDYGHAMSPTSPPPPRTPTRTDPAAVTPNFSIRDRNIPDPFTSPSRRPPSTPPETATATAPNRNNNTSTLEPHYTFRSLYEMLTDERSARRRLEAQMKSLRTEIATLHSQLASQSNIQQQPQSQRSSGYYYAAPASHAMAGSTRLQALLQGTDVSPPSTAHSPQQQQHDSGIYSSPGRTDLMSRFSGSESEMGGWREEAQERDSVQSPYEVYRTPLEEQGRFPWSVPRTGGETDMF